jgi:hypothetical protein
MSYGKAAYQVARMAADSNPETAAVDAAVQVGVAVATDPGARAAGMGTVSFFMLSPFLIGSIITIIIVLIVIANNGFSVGSGVALLISGGILGGCIWIIRSAGTPNMPPPVAPAPQQPIQAFRNEPYRRYPPEEYDPYEFHRQQYMHHSHLEQHGHPAQHVVHKTEAQHHMTEMVKHQAKIQNKPMTREIVAPAVAPPPPPPPPPPASSPPPPK